MKKLVVLSLAIMVLVALPALALRKVDVKTAVLRDMPDAQGTVIQRIGSPKTMGTAIGTTTVDWPCNGNVLNQIAIDNDGGVHLGWTYRQGEDANSRREMYNYRGTDGVYLGATPFADFPGNRWGSINCSHDGIGRGFFYYGANYDPVFAYDAGPGLGVFTLVGIDTAEQNALFQGVPWPRNAKAANNANSDTIYVMGQGDIDQPVFISSYDGGLTWNDWTDLQDGGLFAPDFPDMQIAAGAGGKVCVATLSIDGGPILYRESTDYGVTWGPTTEIVDPLTSCPLGDTLIPYIHTSPFYDNNNDLRVYDAYYRYNINHTGDSTLLYCGILEWTAANGVRYLTSELTSDIQWGATNNLNWSYPNACQHADGTLLVTMVKFDSTDLAANGYANGEVYYTYSQDGGANWSTPYNITQSPTPGAAAGACEDDSYADCAIFGDSLHIIWLNSLDAGQALQGYGALTEDNYYHHAIHYLTGVAGNPPTQPTYGFALNQNRPNPVTRNTEISFNLPKAGDYALKVFNVAGQAVKEFSGQGRAGANSISWNAKDAPNGIYFYKLTAGGNTATKKLVVVK